MSNISGLGSYALAMQNVQIAMTKMNLQASQAAVQLLSEAVDNAKAISASTNLGQNVDISI